MQRARPPFRADHVGSLLRPQRVRDARVRFAKGEIEAAELQRIESLEISTAVQRQKQSGYDRNVYIHYILASGTIDEIVFERLQSKRSVREVLLEAMERRER